MRRMLLILGPIVLFLVAVLLYLVLLRPCYA